jgi:hypothetical protein
LYWVKYLPGQTDSVQHWPDWRQPLRLADGLGELMLQPGGRLRPPRRMSRSPSAFAPAAICISSGVMAAAS